MLELGTIVEANDLSALKGRVYYDDLVLPITGLGASWVCQIFHLFLYSVPPSPEKLGFSVFLCLGEREVKTQE